MSAVLNFFLLNIWNASASLPHEATILPEIGNYLKDVQNAALLSEDMDSWQHAHFPFPLLIGNLSFNVTKSHLVAAVILDARKGSLKSDLRNWKRNADFKFVVLALSGNWGEVWQKVIDSNVCHVLFINVTREKVTFSLRDHICGKIALDPKINATSQCKATVSFMDQQPNVKLSGNRLSGSEGLMFQTVADHLGINLTYVNRHEDEWGGILGDVSSGTSIAGLGSVYPFAQRHIYTEMVFGCATDRFAFAVPVHAGDQLPKWLLILVSELSWQVWVLALLVYILLIPLSIKLNRDAKKKNSDWPLYIFALLIGNPPRSVFNHILTPYILLFGFLMNSHYATMMNTELTAPTEIPNLKTLEKLSESGLKILGPPLLAPLVKEVAEVSEDKVRLKISELYEGTNLGLSVILPRIVKHRDCAFMRNGANILYRAQQDPSIAGQIYIVNEHITSYTPVTMMPKHSCLARKFQKRYRYLCDSGLGSKWIKEQLSQKKTNVNQIGPRQLNVKHVCGFFLLLFIGWSFAFISFIAEILRLDKQ